MDLTLLSTYRAILETGSTQGAARQLGVSQSAVSRRLAQLESELGLSLFVRDKGRLIPAREAQMLDSQIGLLLDHGARLKVRAREMREGSAATDTLRIAFPGSMTLSILPDILEKFLADQPRVQVEVHTGAYDTIERMLLDERAEIGFLRIPAQRSGLATLPVITVPTVCVMARDHPLASRDVVSVQDLARVTMILLGRLRMPRRDIDELFWRYGLRPEVQIEAHSVMSACALAAKGLGVTLVNDLMAKDYAHLPIAVRPLAENLPHRFALATSESAPTSATMREFMRVATNALARLQVR